ncbi:MAG: protein kinase, partial [Muribaculaceae bacterium]|nr:protein kinase [Muribaculaceae bacterium]
MIDNSSSSDFGSGFTAKSFDSVTAGFKDENVCGVGASCVGYRIKHNDIHVAVKRLRRELIHKAEFVSSYRKEFRIGQRLKHDALPVYRNLRDDLEEVYIEMDYIDGITVEDFIRTQAGREYLTSVENVRRFLRELLNVVNYLHRSGVIHCDLKPANIMLRHSDRSVMLLDLDKSYSDILSSNSGGTKSFSEPMPFGEKPTAYKDISAIGRIVDVMADNVPGFPLSRFKRFRKECLNESFSDRRLSAALERKGSRNWFILIGILFFATATPILIRNLSIRNIQTDSQVLVPEVYQETQKNDTLVTA